MQSSNSQFLQADDKASKLKSLGRPMAAVERHLKDRGIQVPTKNDRFFQNVAGRLDDQQFDDLLKQLKYAGRQTINYFIIKGISDHSLDTIEENVRGTLAAPAEVQEVEDEPFLAESEQFNSRLYLAIGYNTNAGSEDPITGKKRSVLATKRIVAVVHENRDLVEIRGSNTIMVEEVRDKICSSLGKYKKSVKSRPDMGPEFQERFSDIVERYLNLRVKVDDKNDSTLDTIAFTSSEDESGNRHDTRDSEKVDEELSNSGSEITMGYVVLDEGLRFQINREQSKLSFYKSEREENLSAVADIIHNVLRQAGEYNQEQISGVSDVPE